MPSAEKRHVCEKCGRKRVESKLKRVYAYRRGYYNWLCLDTCVQVSQLPGN